MLASAAAISARALWAAIGLLLAAFALAPPLLSADVFSYIAYARLGVEHGLNPYEHPPAAAPDDAVFAHVGWRDAVSAYGPLFTLATYPLALTTVPAAVWVLKGTSAAAVATTAMLTARLAAERGAEPRTAAALVALNPLVLVHVVGGAHNDAFMVLALIAGVALLVAGREVAAGSALAAAVAIKASAAFAAPFAILGAARRRRMLAAILAAAAALLGLTLLAFGPDSVAALGLVGENQARMSRYSVPSTLARALGADPEVVRVVALALYAVLVAALLVAVARGADWLRAAGWAAFGLLLSTGWLLPWYVIWVLPLAAVARDRALVGCVLALTAFQLVNRVPL